MLNVNIVYVLCVFLLPTFKHIAKFKTRTCKNAFKTLNANEFVKSAHSNALRTHNNI